MSQQGSREAYSIVMSAEYQTKNRKAVQKLIDDAIAEAVLVERAACSQFLYQRSKELFAEAATTTTTSHQLAEQISAHAFRWAAQEIDNIDLIRARVKP
jgi:hypothetical protein